MSTETADDPMPAAADVTPTQESQAVTLTADVNDEKIPTASATPSLVLEMPAIAQKDQKQPSGQQENVIDKQNVVEESKEKTKGTDTSSHEQYLHMSTDQKIVRLKFHINNFIESAPVVSLMSVCTVWALFSDDIRLCATYKTADIGFEVVISLCFFFFLIEIILASYSKGQEYLYIPPDQFVLPNENFLKSMTRRLAIGSFYFWLDLIATLSLIFEIHWIIGDSLSGGTEVAKGGNATKAGARAGRIIRLVRMVRLIRMVKLYKYASKLTKSETANTIVNADGASEELPPESRVGAALTDLTNRRVIILVLVILIIVPNLQTAESDLMMAVVTQLLDRMGKGFFLISAANYQTALSVALSNALEFTRKLDSGKLLRVTYTMNNNPIDSYFDEARYNLLRVSEMSVLEVDSSNFITTVTFDNRYQVTQDALYAIFTTLFVIVILITGTLFFSSDVNRLVIKPIEKMVELVQKISANPLGVEYKMMGEEDGFMSGMETTVLLTTITKIGGLMRVGFGEAGADVIAKNLNDSNGGKLNLMGGGIMITSIFGFCDVRQFTDTTECLQEEVMLFVNRIAHILHNIVVQCAGSANKNIGDAFLLTWKVDNKLNAEEVSMLADQALYAFCKTLVELNRYSNFICNFSVAATARLFKRFPNYAVRIGSGLHVGWAIEGAIGSHRKIDASYLSPNVNFTEFLESSTKAYGVPLLISEPFYKLLSPEAKQFVRQVDRIRKTARDEPMGIYTYDSDLNIDFSDSGRIRKKTEAAAAKAGLKANMAKKLLLSAAASKRGKALRDDSAPDPKPKHQNTSSALKDKGHAAQRGKSHGADVENPDIKDDDKKAPTIKLTPYTKDIWEEDDDIVELRHMISSKFRSIWGDGMAAYIKGDWRKARDIFHETSKLTNGQDGPSQFLIDLIDHHGGSAPSDWKGFREEGAGGH